jgi:uncharacterized protein (DUF1778 family)
MENEKEKKCRVVTVITEEEKDMLQALAKTDQRSMSSFMRFLLAKEINRDFYSE